MKKFREFLLRNSDIKNILTLVSGTSIAQAISFLSAPILYRIYGKEDYGTLAIYMAIISTVSVFSTMQYLNAILLEDSDQKAREVLLLNRIIVFITTIITIVLVLIFSDYVADKFNNIRIKTWLYFLPISILFGAHNEIYRVWANRVKKYKILALNTIIRSSVVPLTSIIFGLIYNSAEGLLIGYLCGQIIPTLVIYYNLPDKRIFLKNFDKITFVSLLKKHRQFPLYNLPSDFIYRFSNQLPVFMLGIFTNSSIVAIYNLSIRMLGLPIELIGGAIGEVFKQQATAEYNQNKNFAKVFIYNFKFLFGLAIIPLVIVILFAPDIFTFIFSSTWREAGVISQILIFLFVFKFVSSPLSFSFTIVNKLRESMMWHIGILVSNLIIFYTGFKLIEMDYKTVLLLFSINYCFYYSIYLIRSYQFSKLSYSKA